MGRLDKILKEKGFIFTVSLPKNDVALAKAACAAGADAVKVHTCVEHKASGNKFGSWQEEKKTITEIINSVRCPVGLMPGAQNTPTPAELEEAVKAGIDFIDIYDFDMPAWMLTVAAGKMIAAGPDFTVEKIKEMEKLGMDFLEASIVPSGSYRRPLTVQDLENYSILAKATKKPVLVPTQKHIRPQDLKLLVKTGVKGVILGTISIGDTPESFSRNIPGFLKACPQCTK